MSKRPHTGRDETNKEQPEVGPGGVVNLADARVRLRSRLGTNPTRETLLNELEAARLLLDQGLSTEAEFWLTSLIKAARHDKTLLAQARCGLSKSLEVQGQYGEALEAVKMYEAPEARAGLDAETATSLRVQIGIAYNYTGDHPKAIAILKAMRREAAEGNSSDMQ